MKILTIPLNDDNYGYLVFDEESKKGFLVDVSNQPQACYEVVTKESVRVAMVLTTHKHWDHAGGNITFKGLIPECEIIGSAIDDVEGCTKVISDGEEIECSGIRIRAILTPGHTMGHMSYFVEHNGERACFTGDCLFVGGVGKFFEGSAADMYPTLFTKLGGLPQDTMIYCGHEYALSNYRFALSVDADNADLRAAQERAVALRAQGLPTVPHSLADEFRTNPFLRLSSPAIQLSMCMPCSPAGGGVDLVATLAAVREAKNNFR